MYAFIHNEIVPLEKAFFHVSDLSIQRGYGVFDFLKIADGHAFFLDHYLDRFYHSAAVMRLTVPLERDELKTIIYRLIGKNDLKESGMKMILTGGYSPDGYQPAEPNLVITHHKLSLPPEELLREGVKIITHEYVRDIPGVKTINYTMGIWLIEKLKEANAVDVLYHRDEVVSEFPRSNFFIVKHDNTVVTPAENVLPGITRKNILRIAAGQYKAEEGTITLQDVYQAKEAFLTSTTKRIVPVVKVNDNVIGDGRPGEVSMALRQGIIALEEADRKENAYPAKFNRA